MIGDKVFTQNDVLAMRKYSDTNESAGMGTCSSIERREVPHTMFHRGSASGHRVLRVRR